MILIKEYTDFRPIILTTLSLKGKPFPQLKGLLDSGAGITSVSKIHLKNIGVDFNNPDGETDLTSSTGITKTTPLYNINIELGDGLLNKVNFPVACSEQNYKHVDLLIGMDILKECLLILNGKAQVFTLAI